MRSACWCGGSTASTTTILAPHPSVSVPSSQDSLVTASGGPDLTWMKLKILHALFTQNPRHGPEWHMDLHILKTTARFWPCCVYGVFYVRTQSHTICKVVFTSMQCPTEVMLLLCSLVQKVSFELRRFQSSPFLTAARDKYIRMQRINNLRQQFRV